MSTYEIIESWKSDEAPLNANGFSPEIPANPAGTIELKEDLPDRLMATHHCPTIGGAFTCDGYYTCVWE